MTEAYIGVTGGLNLFAFSWQRATSKALLLFTSIVCEEGKNNPPKAKVVLFCASSCPSNNTKSDLRWEVAFVKFSFCLLSVWFHLFCACRPCSVSEPKLHPSERLSEKSRCLRALLVFFNNYQAAQTQVLFTRVLIKTRVTWLSIFI